MTAYNKTCSLQPSSNCQDSPHSIINVLGQNHLALSGEKHKGWMLDLTGALCFSRKSVRILLQVNTQPAKPENTYFPLHYGLRKHNLQIHE